VLARAGRFQDRTERIQGLQTPQLRCCLRACLPRTTSTCYAEWILCRSDRLRNSCRLATQRRRCRSQFRTLCTHRCPKTSPLRTEEQYTRLHFGILPVKFDPPCRQRNQWTQSQACRRPRRGTCSLRSSCRRTESSRRCTSPMGTHHTHLHQPMRSYPRRNRRSLAPESQSFQAQTCHERRGRK
jgi:hypothetical protein